MTECTPGKDSVRYVDVFGPTLYGCLQLLLEHDESLWPAEVHAGEEGEEECPQLKLCGLIVG